MITKCGFNLLNKFLAYDPKRRIVAEEALKHEYFEVRYVCKGTKKKDVL